MGIAPADDVEMAGETSNPIPDDVVATVDETYTAKSSARKKRKMVSEYATVDTIRSFTAQQTIPSLHASSPAGINTLALSSNLPGVFVTGGNDKVVQVYDSSSQKVLHSLKGHTKKVNQVVLREDDGEMSLILSASADKTARVWGYDNASSAYAPKQTFKNHKGEVVGLSVHPSKRFVALASADKTYSLHDLATFQTLYHSDKFDTPFHSITFHPDGNFIGLGTSNGGIQIIDLRTGASAATLAQEDVSPFSIHTISFSENGWQMAAPGSAEGDTLALWDLRKTAATANINLGGGFKLHSVVYDFSAAWLGAAGAGGVKLFAQKTREELWSSDGEAVDLAFGPLGKSVWAVGGREVRVWGA
jgi:pre-mRNA-processing factor 19